MVLREANMAVAVEEHYTRRDLTEAIRDALQQAGKDLRTFSR